MKNYLIVIAFVVVAGVLQTAFLQHEPVNKASLGKLLFFDPILSRDSTISCATCHRPDRAFADTGAVSRGVGGQAGTRNTPSSMNVFFSRPFFWDGRASSLEQQALRPIENPAEMGLPLSQAIVRLNNQHRYREYFRMVFNRDPDTIALAQAIAAFERTLETNDSPFDEWKLKDHPDAVGPAVKRGFELFNGKGLCVKCHFGADLTTNEFRNIGLFDGKKLNDSGRALVTGNHNDVGKFKTSSLRNVAITSPYMHNGIFRTLDEVIEFYNDPAKIIPGNLYRDSVLSKPLGLTNAEKADLKAFLEALTDKRFLSPGHIQ